MRVDLFFLPVKAKICRMSGMPDVYVMNNNQELIMDAESICLTWGNFKGGNYVV